MSELRATSSTLLSVIEATARRPAEVVGAISTFCFALLAADLFCIATGRHSWSAVAVYIGRIATDKPLATPVSIGIVIATLAVLRYSTCDVTSPDLLWWLWLRLLGP